LKDTIHSQNNILFAICALDITRSDI